MKTQRQLMFLFVAFCFVAVVFPQSEENNSEGYKGKWISSIEFEGNETFTSQELIDLFQSEDDVAGRVNRLFIRPYDQKHIEHFLQKELRDFLFSRGYLKALVGNAKPTSEGDSVKLIVPIEEGIRYRFGKIKISGTKALKPRKIEEFLDFKQGDIVEGKMLNQKAYKELPKFYGNQGFAECNVEIENVSYKVLSRASNEGIVDLDIVVDEGLVFRIGQINIVGNADHTAVRSILTFKKGEIFNQAKLDESVKRINETELYEKIDYESDVEIQKNYPDESKIEDSVEIVSRSRIAHKLRLPNDTEKTTREVFGKATINIRVKKLQPVRHYYLGSARFVGNKTISDDELKEALGLNHHGYFDIKRFLEKVREFNTTCRLKPIVEDDLELELGQDGKEDDEFSEQLNITLRIRELDKHTEKHLTETNCR